MTRTTAVIQEAHPKGPSPPSVLYRFVTRALHSFRLKCEHLCVVILIDRLRSSAVDRVIRINSTVHPFGQQTPAASGVATAAWQQSQPYVGGEEGPFPLFRIASIRSCELWFALLTEACIGEHGAASLGESIGSSF